MAFIRNFIKNPCICGDSLRVGSSCERAIRGLAPYPFGVWHLNYDYIESKSNFRAPFIRIDINYLCEGILN